MATRKVVKVRGENRREDAVYFAELVLDGVKIRAQFGNTNLASKATHYYDRFGERYATPEEAAKRFEALLEGRVKSYSDVKRSEEEVEVGDESVSAGASNPALEKEILAARDPGVEHSTSSVYADWLQTQSDVRGELAGLFLGGQEDDARRWIADNPTRLFGPLDVKLDSEVYALDWRNGFLRGASLKRASIDSNTKLGELTAQFLALPVARLVTELRFGLAGYESDNDWSDTMQAIVDSPQAAQLRVLRFDDYTYEDSEISWTAFGDFSPFWSKLPALEELQIRSGEGGTLGELALPNLKTFVRVSGGLGADEIKSIMNASWPKLEHLEIWFGKEDYGAAGSVESLAPLLDGRVPKTLRHLGLVNCEFSHELIEPLAKSPVLRQLKSLDLSKGVIQDRDVDVLLRHADAFAHLESLDLSENLLNERGRDIHAKMSNANVGAQRFDDGDDDDRRFVALGE